MKISKFFLIFLCLFAYSFANDDLAQSAKDQGLIPLPKSKKALDELIEKYAIDYKLYPTTKERVELGKMLYFDPRLSKSSLISCNTCHNLGLGGADGVETSIGDGWKANPHNLNAPTVLNSVFNEVQFWDGRAGDLASQAMGPMLSLPEMASSKELIEARINSIPEYKDRFKKAYDSNATFELVAASIGIFERTLVTRSRYDDFLNGDKNALNEKEKKGLKKFLELGCVNCHDGINLGGKMQPFEMMQSYEFANVGDFKGNKDGLVKVPTLRNILLTYPYFHNGKIWDIKRAIKDMGSIQLGVTIDDKSADEIAEFFKALTGEMPKIEYPILPPSTLSTPRPIPN